MLKPSGKKATPGRLFASEEVEKLDSEDLNLLHETAWAIRRSGRVNGKSQSKMLACSIRLPNE